MNAPLPFPSTRPLAADSRLGDELIKSGVVTLDQIEAALHEKSRTNKLLGTILVELGFLTPAALNDALAARTGLSLFDASNFLLDTETAQALPRREAEMHKCLILGLQEDGYAIGMIDPYDVIALDAAKRHLPAETYAYPVILTNADFAALVDSIYGNQSNLSALIRDMRHGAVARPTDGQDGDIVRDYTHPVVRFVNALLLEAVKSAASDIHIEPEEYFIRIRTRIDGDLQQIATLHHDFWQQISHRVKIMAGLNIANKLSPQDGRFSLSAFGRNIDFRVATLPGAYGENIVIRLLDRARGTMRLSELGFSERQLAQIKTLLRKKEGLIVMTGPTGSGKTTTLYAMLQELSSVDRNIMTLEDPIEYRLPLIRQTQVREGGQNGVSFADGVRAILRQDPDIILIGEIRDTETAQMAVRAAMTGHLVLTTLHTRDVFGVVPRLIDLGLTPGLLAGNLNGIIAQRLVKRHDGQGRLAVAEILTITPALDKLLLAAQFDRNAWRQAAEANGFHSFTDIAKEKLAAGEISAAQYDDIQLLFGNGGSDA